MEKKNNVFVFLRGVPSRGDDVIGELTKRGGRNPNRVYGHDARMLYFINHRGIIDCIYDKDGDWILSHYTEITLEESL